MLPTPPLSSNQANFIKRLQGLLITIFVLMLVVSGGCLWLLILDILTNPNPFARFFVGFIAVIVIIAFVSWFVYGRRAIRKAIRIIRAGQLGSV